MTTLEAQQRRYIWTETAINAAVNTAISALFVWVAFRGMSSIPLWGATGLAVDLIPTCFAITLVSTLILTLLTRVRLKKGVIRGLHGVDGIAASLPANVLIRAFSAAIVVTVVAVPLTTGLLFATGADGMSYSWVLIFKLVFGALLSLLVGPPLLKRALTDRVVRDQVRSA